MSIYKDFYDNITPEKSNEQFVIEIINAKKPKMKLSPRKITAAGIAAATAMTVTVTGYASGWDYSAVFEQIFGEKAANIETHLVSEATEICDDIDHLDFEIVAAAADRQGVLVIVDIIPQNVLPEELSEDILDDLDFGIYYENSHRGSLSYHAIEHTEEKTRVSLRAQPRENITGEKVTVYAHGSVLHNMITEKEDNKYITGREEYWRAEFTADYEGSELEYPADLTYTGNYGGTFHIDRIVVTPISVYAIGEKSNSKDLLSVEEEYDYTIRGNYVGVTSGNGTIQDSYAVINNGENTDKEEIDDEDIINFRAIYTDFLGKNNGEDLISMSFNEPINPEDITAVVISGTVIELK